ncbi:angiotensin-converting enzyme-like isoform X2 [Macrosteles quadrilineatus]|nr:angiotensin-converting enzyme-like isoform X2 [Macrosteles quadrilineatus]XP_054280632.1 angiotensin-converting enzyme-like isoform X2 [Macrosteles quadrilineatus]XP_054280633.1 angiotensin-converting enzyme-like isoform X2 [Macrosteles quadrilineatus]
MRWVWLVALVTEVRLGGCVNPDQDQDGEVEARNFMDYLNRETASWANRISLVEWDYESNLTEHNLQRKLKLAAEYAAFEKEQWREVIKFHWQNFQDPLLRRQFKKHSILGTAALPEEKRSRLDEVVSEMQKIYSTTKLHEWRHPRSTVQLTHKEPMIQLEPDLVQIFSGHTNESCKLQYYWEGWHGSVGRKVKYLFEEYVNLTNEAAKMNNFSDNAAMWIEDFEMENFEDVIQKLYLQIRPLYQQLHAYVRRRLSTHHNTNQQELIQKSGHLPAHILGNMWAQQWDSVYHITVPYPGKVSVDVTPTMKAKNYTALKMFKLAEEFFTSLNLTAMTDTFWNKSIIEKPTDREMVCHASAWDFYDGEDFRIKMCTRINLDDLKTVHHEMGHIQYFQQYKNQPYVFRSGANSGFHEAVGDTLALSVSTAEHLMKIGLLDPDTYVEDRETDINSLYLMALEKVAFLPFAYILDLWRWEVFRGNITPPEYNCRFWKLRQDLQGIVPPVDRKERDFDAGAKYHVIADVPYIRYFVSFIIQFQFHKALCIKAGQYNPKDPASKPLHQCDIYQSTEAGNLMGDMLQLGSSKHWQDAFEAITGQRNMDAGPLLEYFQPLHDWLINENNRTGEEIGWSTNHKINFCHNAFQTEPTPEAKPVDDGCHYLFADEKMHKVAMPTEKKSEDLKQANR